MKTWHYLPIMPCHVLFMIKPLLIAVFYSSCQRFTVNHGYSSNEKQHHRQTRRRKSSWCSWVFTAFCKVLWEKSQWQNAESSDALIPNKIWHSIVWKFFLKHDGTNKYDGANKYKEYLFASNALHYLKLKFWRYGFLNINKEKRHFFLTGNPYRKAKINGSHLS